MVGNQHSVRERARLSVLRRISAASSWASISDRLAALRSARTPSYAVCCARSRPASSWTRARSSAAAACSVTRHARSPLCAPNCLQRRMLSGPPPRSANAVTPCQPIHGQRDLLRLCHWQSQGCSSCATAHCWQLTALASLSATAAACAALARAALLAYLSRSCSSCWMACAWLRQHLQHLSPSATELNTAQPAAARHLVAAKALAVAVHGFRTNGRRSYSVGSGTIWDHLRCVPSAAPGPRRGTRRPRAAASRARPPPASPGPAANGKRGCYHA